MGVEVKRFFLIGVGSFTMYAMLLPGNVAHARSTDLLKLRSELALFSCVKINYQSLGVDIFKSDFSYFHPRYKTVLNQSTVEDDSRLGEFLTKHAGTFYKEEISVKSENSRGPYTIIFAKCTEFADSTMLRAFFQKNPLSGKLVEK